VCAGELEVYLSTLTRGFDIGPIFSLAIAPRRGRRYLRRRPVDITNHGPVRMTPGAYHCHRRDRSREPVDELDETKQHLWMNASS